jgi:hypothetical protein
MLKALLWHHNAVLKASGICGLVGKATTYVGGDVGSIPTCGALEVWRWTFGSRIVWLVNKSAGQPQFTVMALQC